MKTQDKIIARIANRVYNACNNSINNKQDFTKISDKCKSTQKELTSIKKKIKTAIKFQTICKRDVPTKFIEEIQDYADWVRNYATAIKTPRTESHKISYKEIFYDIKSLFNDENFTDIQYKNYELSACTKAVVLEDIYLGRFRIVLNLSEKIIMGLNAMFWAEAIDPNPAAENESVIHPHINDQNICFGDSEYIINKRLKEGMVYDCFNIINSLINTYNSSSAHVLLENWNGEENCNCSICGIDTQELYECSYCNELACADCNSSCSRCNRECCAECSYYCIDCEEQYCHKCIKSYCKTCGDMTCNDCIIECEECGNKFCSKCINKCDSCNKNCCSCSVVQCNKCSTEMCEECTMKCDNCNKEFCDNCYDECQCNLFMENVSET